MTHDHGSTAIAGIAYYAADQFPEEFRDTLFIGNVVTNRINRDRIEWHGSTPKGIEQPDFVWSATTPGSARWTSSSARTARSMSPTSTTASSATTRSAYAPGRDRERGRIWRVVWRGAERAGPALALPDLSKENAPALLDRLRVHNVTLRNLVVSELSDRLGVTAVPTWRDAAMARLESSEPKPPGEALGLIYALERNGAAPNFATPARWMEAGGERGLGVLQVLANRADLDPAMESVFDRIAAAHPPGPLWLGLSTLCTQHPRSWQSPRLLAMLAATPVNDPQLIYGLRLALKHAVSAASLAELRAWAALKPAYADALADVCLAVVQPVAADFLLTHLERTQFSGPRVGDFVRQVAEGMSADKFDALLGSARRLNPAAGLTQQLAVCEGLGLAAKRLKRPLPADLQDWSEAVASALENADAKLVERGLEASATLATPAVMDAWEKIVLSPKAVNLRTAALQLFPADERGRQVASRALEQGADGRLLDPVLARLGPEAAGEPSHRAVAAALIHATPEQSVPLATALAGTDDGASRLLVLVEGGQVAPRLLLRTSVTTALESGPPAFAAAPLN